MSICFCLFSVFVYWSSVCCGNCVSNYSISFGNLMNFGPLLTSFCLFRFYLFFSLAFLLFVFAVPFSVVSRSITSLMSEWRGQLHHPLHLISLPLPFLFISQSPLPSGLWLSQQLPSQPLCTVTYSLSHKGNPSSSYRSEAKGLALLAFSWKVHEQINILRYQLREKHRDMKPIQRMGFTCNS